MKQNDFLKLHLFGWFALLSGSILLILVLVTTLSLGLAGGSHNLEGFWRGLLSLALGLCQASILTSFGLQFLQLREITLDGHELRLRWTACLLASLLCTMFALALSQPLAIIGILTLLGLWLLRGAVIRMGYS